MRIGVDIGGTGLRAATVGRSGTGPLQTLRNDDRSIDGIVEAVVRLVRPLGEHAIGVAVPGFVESGRVLASPNFPTWHDVPLADLLTERLARPVRLCNDADAAALGVARQLALRQVVVVTLGTGVGGGVIVGGELLPGRAAGELGHLWAGGSRLCGCGATGCLETLASVSAVRVRAAALGERPDLDALITRCPPDHEVWSELIEGLAHGLRTLVNLFGPDAIVLLGGMTAARGVLEAAIARFRMETLDIHRDLPVHILGRADRFAILGAATYCGNAEQVSP